jgi:hypothetical protein
MARLSNPQALQDKDHLRIVEKNEGTHGKR